MSSNYQIDKSWTLFLDRDGVINKKREYDYVKTWDEFVFLEGSVKAISILSKLFARIIVVTNQRCVGKGIISEQELNSIHDTMIEVINVNNGRIDKIFFCPEVSDFAECRKPNLGMAQNAISYFPEIDFTKSVIVGDSMSDMIFGKRAGMLRFFICSDISIPKRDMDGVDLIFPSLLAVADFFLESRTNDY
jgi:histidinol-phosphate phosphatase family protein